MSTKLGDKAVSSDKISKANRIDSVCDRFEALILSDKKPSIREFLDSAEGRERTELFSQLLLIEMEYLQAQGKSQSKLGYQESFPEFLSEIEAIDFQYGFGSTIANQQLETRIEEPKTGTQVAHFELLKRVGSGAAGEVWKAKDISLGRTVAVKIPRQVSLTDNEMKRFRREGTTAAQLRHPNIVSVHEVGRDKRFAYIATEFIEGTDLREWMPSHEASDHEVAELCAQLAEALQHAHDLGVVHRDLKPANILLDEEGCPHITDFGLAKRLDDDCRLTLEGQLLGTPAYMSPEQAKGDSAKADPRSDVYSLGMLLYEMLTKVYPFKGNHAAIVNAVIHQEPTPPRSRRKTIPQDLETICLKAIEKQPSRRYASAQEMAVDLRRFLRGEAIFAQRSGPLQRSWRWVKRRPAMAAATFFALIACGSLASAMILADQNFTLRGWRTVRLTTDVPGAKVAFVPLSETSGSPQREKVIFARGTTPVEAELPPGDYLVVAVLPDGRFHEVYRHVPKKSVQIPGAFNHLSSKPLPGGELLLPKIVIPEATATEGMAFVEGSSKFYVSQTISSLAPDPIVQVASFFMDTHEFTFEDYREVSHRLPKRFQLDSPASNAPLSLNYDSALQCAELLGKRLPSETEYLFAATDGGNSLYPWGSEFPEVITEQESHTEYAMVADALPTEPPIVGLCSGKAEWTSSWSAPEFADSIPEMKQIDIVKSNDYRTVRGGDYDTIRGDYSFSHEKRDPIIRISINRHRQEPGLGFRCVRSLRPFFTFDEIP